MTPSSGCDSRAGVTLAYRLARNWHASLGFFFNLVSKAAHISLIHGHITSMTSPIVRFAPSPTGRLHVGNVRTALINWLFAHSQGGKFILRIDDTDVERSTKENEDALKVDLEWLGLVWADTFNQSDRFAQYDAAAEKLRGMGLLYPC